MRQDHKELPSLISFVKMKCGICTSSEWKAVCRSLLFVWKHLNVWEWEDRRWGLTEDGQMFTRKRTPVIFAWWAWHWRPTGGSSSGPLTPSSPGSSASLSVKKHERRSSEHYYYMQSYYMQCLKRFFFLKKYLYSTSLYKTGQKW